MMTKEEHIQYWITSAKNDWKVVISLYKIKKYIYSLFFAHLVLEKLIKAHWVKDNESNYPQRLHNLVTLIEQTKLNVSSEQKEFFVKMNTFQLEGRYPDYQLKIYKLYSKKNTAKILKNVKEIKKWLLNNLQ
ncbi:MAG: HEPN domain-containing protein [Bacteroidia bacterium]|nr:HEPN domain-containing protein [Bacteroidia bacterium]